MAKPEISLQPTESTVAQSAVQLYSAYVIAGKVEDGKEKEWMRRALKEAVLFARTAEGIDASQPENPSDETSSTGGEKPPQPAKTESDQATDAVPGKEELEALSSEAQRDSKKSGQPAQSTEAEPGLDEVPLELDELPEEDK